MVTRTTSDIAKDIQHPLVVLFALIAELCNKYGVSEEDHDRMQGLIDEALKPTQELKGPLPKASGGCSTSVRV